MTSSELADIFLKRWLGVRAMSYDYLDMLKESDLDSGKYGYELVQLMIEHEMHHQGQLINRMFCHHLPIPKSWRDKWALSYDE